MPFISKVFSPFIKNLFKKHTKKHIIDAVDYENLVALLQNELAQKKGEEILILMPDETAMVKKIRIETNKWNTNNVTRTQAYLNFYKKNPEIHWAFLAHMVSRNGGYYMTDLKGEIMDQLLSEEDKKKYFRFLEHANSYIFADAYPQLLLYEYSKKQTIDFRKMLSLFHVSKFMNPIWHRFLVEGDSALLTVSLIINEQRMLEERLFKKSHDADIFKRMEFQLQDFLGFTTVIFPYLKKQTDLFSLTGQTIQRFSDPKARIETGKRLYGLLFQHVDVYKGVYQFAKTHAHTGSREDYWPSIFTNKRVRTHHKKLYSPILYDAWSNEKLSPIPFVDWFNHIKLAEDLTSWPEITRIDITQKVYENTKHLSLLNELKSV